MAKSIIKLPNGTIITIEGNPEEVKKIISVYFTEPTESSRMAKKKIGEKIGDKEPTKDIALEITNHIKNCDEADVIEKKILDRLSQVDRVLLPLYIADQLDEKISLTSGDIYRVLKNLGINMRITNVSKTLGGTALKYVIGDRRAKKGEAVKYSISRPGKQYISKVLGG